MLLWAQAPVCGAGAPLAFGVRTAPGGLTCLALPLDVPDTGVPPLPQRQSLKALGALGVWLSPSVFLPQGSKRKRGVKPQGASSTRPGTQLSLRAFLRAPTSS